jgi:multidrug efflux pump subunit AcrB
VLVSAFVSLTLTPMLNAYLMKGGEQKKSKFYNATEPYFEKLNKGYADSLTNFMKRKWISFPILIVCFGLIYLFFSILQKETAPYDDRSAIVMSITTPEGSTHDYTDRFMQELGQLVDDSIPEKTVSLVITSPGLWRVDGEQWPGAYCAQPARRARPLAKGNSREAHQMDQTIFAGKGCRNRTTHHCGKPSRRIAHPVHHSGADFREVAAENSAVHGGSRKNPVFSTVDVNLKFNKPEVDVTIDRAKAESLGISVWTSLRRTQLSLSGQRFGYFIMNGKQYQVIGQYDQKDRSKPLDLTSMFVKNNKGEMIQMDNVVSIAEKATHRNSTTTTATCRLRFLRVWLRGKVSETASTP